MTSPREQLPANPHGMTETMKRVYERSLRTLLIVGGAGHDISSGMLGDSILDDPDCQGSRALRALGVDLSAAPRTERSPNPGPWEVMMIGFSPAANKALRSADRMAREEGRLTATGDLLLGLFEADPEWAAGLGVEAASVRDTLGEVEREG